MPFQFIQGSRKRETRPSVSSRLDLKPPMDESLVSFHKELTETCLDLMSMYTFATCSPVPKRFVINPTSVYFI